MEYRKDNEPISALTHLLGFFLSIAALVLLVVESAQYSNAWHVVSFSIFGSCLLLLYLASTIYHFIPKSSRHKKLFQKFDFSMIFFLIAGTYTPILLIPMRGAWGWSLFGVVWAIAMFGIITQIFKIKIKPWIMTLLYVAMGWIVVIALPILLRALPENSFAWLLTGGIAYTVGAVFYALDKIWPRGRLFGLHEVFHVFVLIGSFCHFWLMFKYIILVQ